MDMNEEMKQKIYESAEQIYKDGYHDGYYDCKGNLGDMYDNGLKDAWECARKIISFWVGKEAKELFNTDDISSIFNANTVGQAISKVAEYEDKQRKSEEMKASKCGHCEQRHNQTLCRHCKDFDRFTDERDINVGNEVHILEEDECAIVTNISGFNDSMATLLWEDSGKAGIMDIALLMKTGRHFPQFVEFLEKVKE